MMPELPDLTLPDNTRGKFETLWDLKPLLYQGGAAVNVKMVNVLIDSGQLGELLIERLQFVEKVHEIFRGRQERGDSKETIADYLVKFRGFCTWAEATGHRIDFNEIEHTYRDWAEYLLHEARVRKINSERTAYAKAMSVGAVLDDVLDRELPLLQTTRLENPKRDRSPLGVEADKQNIESTFRFGHLIQDICDHIKLEVLWGPLPVCVPLREGGEFVEWSKLRPETKVLTFLRDTSKRRSNARRIETLRADHEADRTLKTRYPIANLRIEAELQMFIGQTGMNLSQAHKLKLCQFSYASYLDGYHVRDYKERRGGQVLFEIYREYKKHFERYLEWRRQVFPNEELLFPLFRFGRAEDMAPEFPRVKGACAKTGIPYMPPGKLRNTRVNWLLRRSRDPDRTAELDQHTKQVLLGDYERPSLQVAMSEITRFWSQADPALARTVPVALGECDGNPKPVPGMPANATQPDCVQRSGCLWCTHHRDIDSLDYVWALVCFHHIKVIELSRLRGPGDVTKGHPALLAIDRILQKMHYFRDSNELRRSWVDEAMARVDEGSYHPDWERLIENME